MGTIIYLHIVPIFVDDNLPKNAKCVNLRTIPLCSPFCCHTRHTFFVKRRIFGLISICFSLQISPAKPVKKPENYIMHRSVFWCTAGLFFVLNQSRAVGIVGYLLYSEVCELSPLVPQVKLSNNSDCVGCGVPPLISGAAIYSAHSLSVDCSIVHALDFC